MNIGKFKQNATNSFSSIEPFNAGLDNILSKGKIKIFKANEEPQRNRKQILFQTNNLEDFFHIFLVVA